MCNIILNHLYKKRTIYYNLQGSNLPDSVLPVTPDFQAYIIIIFRSYLPFEKGFIFLAG